MTIFGLLGILVVLGLAVWLITSFVPMAPQFKTLILVVGLLIAVLFILSAFGILGALNAPVPQVR
jgi:tetrahydromethanopterin S-methyltransferase subunit C